MSLAVVVPITKPDVDVVKAARELLERCETGEICSFVLATQQLDGSIGTQFVLGEHNDLFRLMGATHHLLGRLSRKADEP